MGMSNLPWGVLSNVLLLGADEDKAKTTTCSLPFHPDPTPPFPVSLSL